MAKKKTFIAGIEESNPALQFISTPAEEPESRGEIVIPQPKPDKPPEGYKKNPLYIEVKSRRLQLVLQPSLYERVRARAEATGLSVNEYIHQILDNATREE